MRWRRRLRNWLLGLLAFVLICLASISTLLETQAGSRWLLHTIARWVPMELGEINGDLRSGLDISYIDYSRGQQHFRIEQASFRWRPVSALYGTLSIQSLKVERLFIQLPPSDKPKDSAPPFSNWPRLGLPIRIELGNVQLNQIEFQQGDTRMRWESLSGSLSLGTFHLRYRDLGLVHKGYSLKLTGITDLTFPYDTEAELEWRIGAKDADSSRGAAFPYLGSGELEGDLRHLQLVMESRQPVVLQAEASLALVDEQDFLILAPQIQLKATLNQQQLPGAWWFPGQVPPVTTAELTAKGNWQDYTAQLQGKLLAPDVPGLAITANVQGNTRGLAVKQLRLTELLTQPTAIASSDQPPVIAQWLAVSGDLAWLPTLEWNLDAQGEHLNFASLLVDWPSNLQLRFNSKGQLDYATRQWRFGVDQLQVEGSLRDLNLEAKGNLEVDKQAWRSQGLHLVLGANQLSLKGGLDKNLQLDWDLRAPMLGQLDTNISGSLISKGQIRGQLQLPQVALDLTAENLAWDKYHLAQLALSIKPKAELVAAASDASSLDETALLAAPYDVLLNGRKLQLPGTSLSSFSLKGDGSANQHQLQATAKSPQYGSLELALKGSYGTGEWTGSLQQASVKFKKVPRWWLVSGKPIHISARDISVADQCFTTTTNLTATVERNPVSLQSQAEWNPNQSPVNNANNWVLTSSTPSASPVDKTPPPRLCIQGNWMPESGMQLNALLDAVPLRQFYALFKPEVFFAGVMDGSLKVSTKSFQLDDINARFGLTTRNAELRYQFSGGITEVYPWNNTGVEATLEKGQLKAAARMQWVGYGYLEANSQVNLLTQKIDSGSLVARFDNLAPLETLLTVANDVAGDLRVDLSAGGTVKKPEISGDISIKNGSANLPKLGLDLKQIQMNLAADKSEQISLSGQMQSGEGQINLEAQLNKLGSPDWQATGSLKGSNFNVINVPRLKINLNPDVQLEANAQTLRFSGEALIPWARAVIKTLPPSTTRVSSDVVIEDEQHSQTAAAAGGVEVYTNIKLTLGDDVTFKGFGLDSQLSGVMQLFKDAQRRQLLTNGFVAVKKGTYKAYGQNLTIERGRLIFQGPYENPGLDIRASRKIDDEDETQVGLEISGTLQRPIAKVYAVTSDPVSDSEAMMMLLTGKPVTSESRAEATLLMGAISGLGGDSENITTGIAQFFRVDELAINSEKGIEQSELWIGKQLTPQLMVRYVVGLFDQMVSLGVEYQLTDRLRVEAESGEIQSMDVIYRIER